MSQEIENLKSAIQSSREAIQSHNPDEAEKLCLNMCYLFERDYQIDTPSDYTPEMALVQYQAFDVLIDLHIMRGNPIDVSFRMGTFLKKYRKDREVVAGWSEDDWKPINDIVAGVIKKVYSFNQHNTHKNDKMVVRDEHCRCELCRRNLADKTGSHMVPHMLIAKTFSYDGSTDREKVVVDVTNLSSGTRERYFGHNVYDDTVNELLGRSLTDDEVESEAQKTNALTIDHIFCSDCEKRLGVIESWYAEILNGKKEYPSYVPYLFWMSVIWRMAVGDMGMVMYPEHQEKLRNALDKCLANNREEYNPSKSKLGHCAYSIYKASDTKDETLGIFCPHDTTIPYQALIGNVLINFYMSESASIRFAKAHDLPVSDFNFGKDPEKCGGLSFIEFWIAKRQLLDMSWKHGRSLWHLGQNHHRVVNKYEKSSNIYNGKPVQMSTLPDFMNAENPYVMNIPRAIRKIVQFVEKCPEANVQQISDATGYTEEELGVMMSYWEKALEERDKKVEDFNHTGEMLNALC